MFRKILLRLSEFLLFGWWQQQVFPKRRCLSNKLHDITSKKTITIVLFFSFYIHTVHIDISKVFLFTN